MRRQTGEVVIECVRANIANQEGIAGAIHDGAGPGLEEECRPFAPIEPGEAVLTGAYNLPNNYVIHVLGP
ncbi:MAG: RNase III inhibitor, partial [Candidatus Omnitrophica bacterium]|nr:RNase III inhibitor [Candidatus Omnitrophota bacterium]